MDKLSPPIPTTLQIEVLSPEKVLYKGSAQSVSSVNKKGKFDILPGHTSFISLIRKQVIVQTTKQNKKKFDLQHGVIRCQDNIVRVYIGL